MPYLTLDRDDPPDAEKARPIAVVTGGRHNAKILYWHPGYADEAKKAEPAESGAGLGAGSKRKRGVSEAVGRPAPDTREANKILTELGYKPIQRMRTLGYLEQAYADDVPEEDIQDEVRPAYAAMLKKTAVSGKEQRIELDDGSFFPVPTPVDDGKSRDVWVIAAPSGAGKSTFAGQICKLYHKLWPKRKLYLLTEVEADPAFDELVPVGARPKRINIHTLLNDPVQDLSEFKDSAVFADDLDALDEKLQKAVQLLINKILTMGRHQQCSVFVLQHQLNNYKQSRLVNFESQAAVVFPGATKYHSIHYFLKQEGWTDQQIRALKKVRSRWVYVRKTVPLVCVSEVAAWIQDDDDIGDP